MAHAILGAISAWIIHIIGSLGYGGVVLLMAIESANIPLPSEVIMPFAGFLAASGGMNIWLAGLAGGVGCTIGSAFSWALGAYGGRSLVERYGKYVLLCKEDVATGERWFRRYGNPIAFFSRLLPVVRTFISFPAGIAKVPLGIFLLYTFIGSVIWSTALAYVGKVMGDNWENLKRYFHGADWVIIGIIVIGIVWWVGRHVRRSQNSNVKTQN